ncbi:BTB/POZ domain-containing protein NPY1 [Impatiens glandulifera]|uniref:BTB/POZ domain-containing protein NPY1 n=1 Tax=Impatiens glandulifera TaxID=253017 RepID=UPI001FB12453|nr:BTB/POZ domain-containing protein NPY1 [Impatiens glandulifera]
MKFMKLGSKPDAFHTEGNCIRFVSTDLISDVIIIVGEVKFHLHKFPLISKCNRLQKLIHKANEENSNEICLVDFPGGPKSFEICAKFCYGMTVTLSAYNVVAARCAAEYLEMTEEVDKGNLVFKIEVFLNSTIFRTWKDSIIVLQTTKPLLPWSEELKVVGRCIDSIASKTSVDPSNVTWSYTYNRKLQETPDKITEIRLKQQLNDKIDSIPPKDWWVEDICDLDIDLYRRFMVAVRSKGRMDGNMIGEALKTYLTRWLPNSVEVLVSESQRKRQRGLIDMIVGLLPSDKSACSCGFLLKLLKYAVQVGVEDTAMEDLMKRISMKLDEASVNDLLMMTPPGASRSMKYDVELVHSLVSRFMTNDYVEDETERNAGGGFGLGCGSILDVGKLIDDYLAGIAYDPNLPLSVFVELARLIPSSARPIHDGLYKAIDIYLKEHPNVTKAERKKVSSLMDVKKLTAEASAHAAQNERLPLRVVVQVLFFEQVRTSSAIQPKNDSYSDWEKSVVVEDRRSLRKQLSQVKISRSEETTKYGKLTKKGSNGRESGSQLLPSRSRRIFDKIWMTVGKGHGNRENSETSGSSRSPTASMVQVEAKSFRSLSTRNRRNSIS